MNPKRRIVTAVLLLLSPTILAFGGLAPGLRAQEPAASPGDAEARRLQVMFFGAPTENGPHHDPITRYRRLKMALGIHGIDLTYVDDPGTAFSNESARLFDVWLMYGNWHQNESMPRAQLDALLSFVRNGGGFVPVHCASACYGGSPEFVELVGARFRSHGGEIFRARTVEPRHELLRGWTDFEAWDETYVHDAHNEDRQVLQMRGDEPWTWVREHGDGRIFYTASGHDHRVWDLVEFHDLMRRAILWSAGDRAKVLERLALPVLRMEEVSLPGYRERREITEAQAPLSPEESAKLIQVPPGFRVELFCSEPDIVNPIHIAWDERGRAFVIETIDYPNNLQAGNVGNDRITICEDTDGDGRADRFVRFAEGLSIPTSLCFANGGVVCTNGSEMLFLKDTDGDDVADVREVLFSGFSMGDTHAGVSNLRYGIDGWIYATIGYSGFRDEVGGERHSFGQGVFRFRADGSALEFLQNTTNNTWGLGFTEDFDVVGSTANGNPSFYLTFPRADYERAGMEQPRTPAADDNPVFFPISEDIRQVDQFDRYTAAAGHAVCTTPRFPAGYQDRIAFVCGPTGKLVGQFDMRRTGAGFEAIQRPNNLFASADAWTAPVCCEIGPDGAAWICDWYNIVVQHNPTPSRRSAGLDAETGQGNAYVTPLRDKQHGRIWRVFPDGTTASADPQLDRGDASTLLKGLGHSDQFWRLQAQRLLVEQGGASLTEALEDLVTGSPIAAPYALHALGALDALQGPVLARALAADDEHVRRAAVRIADPKAVADDTVDSGLGRFAGRELAERLVALSRLPADAEVGAMVYQALRDGGDRLLAETAMRDAFQMAALRHADGLLAAASGDGVDFAAEEQEVNLLANPDFESVDGQSPADWTDLRRYGGADPRRVRISSSTDGRNGTRSMRVDCDETIDAGIAQVLRVEPGARYRLSGWLKTENVVPRGNSGMMFNVHGGPNTRGLVGDNDWTFLSLEFEAWTDEVIVHCLFGGYGGCRGTVWFDDVSLVRLGSTLTVEGFCRTIAERRGGSVEAGPVAREFEPDPEVHERGQVVYQKSCIACHGIDGLGVPNVFPSLHDSTWLTADKETPIKIVLHGLVGPVEVDGKVFNSVMAPLGFALTDQEIADVLTLVRQSYGNDASPVTVEEVRAVRDQYADRVKFWTQDELGR